MRSCDFIRTTMPAATGPLLQHHHRQEDAVLQIFAINRESQLASESARFVQNSGRKQQETRRGVATPPGNATTVVTLSQRGSLSLRPPSPVFRPCVFPFPLFSARATFLQLRFPRCPGKYLRTYVPLARDPDGAAPSRPAASRSGSDLGR